MTKWRSPDGVGNAASLREAYSDSFEAFAELDALGHRVLTRATDAARGAEIDQIVGIALLRRLVTAFVGIRHLLESSAIQPALLVARSQFEILLAIRYLVHGADRDISRDTPTVAKERAERANSYYVAGLRTAIHRRQAIVDGVDGLSPITDQAERSRLEEEIASEVGRLEEFFAVENNALGALACFPPEGKKPRYYDPLPWYSPGFPNPEVKSIKALARALGASDQYFLLYGPFSDLGHARNTEHDVTIEDGVAAIRSPYDPTAFAVAAYWPATWQGFAINLICRAYSPESWEDQLRVYQKVTKLLSGVGEEATGVFLG